MLNCFAKIVFPKPEGIFCVLILASSKCIKYSVPPELIPSLLVLFKLFLLYADVKEFSDNSYGMNNYKNDFKYNF